MQQKKRVKFVNKNRTQFLKVLKQRVDAYFEENKIDKHANKTMVFKSIVMLSLYTLPIIAIYVFNPLPNWAVLICYAISGFGIAGVGMGVMHDANHGAYSKNKLVNSIMGGTLNILGGFDVNWKSQHNILHHTYTNITHLDEDIDQRLKMRWSPFFKWHPIQKYQHIYAFFAYCLATLSWVIMKDYKQFFTYSKNGVNKMSSSEYAWNFFKLFFYKILYITYIILIPIWVLGYNGWLIFGGLLLMHAIGGFFLSTVFQLAHVVEGADFPMPNDKGEIENEWAIHQLATTADFGHDNAFLTWFAGGLTHQIEHHLFPDICHVHYPQIAKYVQQTADEFGLPYNNNPGYFAALKSHIVMLKKFGLQSDFDLANV
ncbi:MAG: acyl-CoA desaturase [Chitinophagaceae bacterium]|nr:acyl-CoA desaturase [Chitinophagaceae bacterium]HMN31875.1 acyl-CoA desaturase [Chitinophagaceae bacterium]